MVHGARSGRISVLGLLIILVLNAVPAHDSPAGASPFVHGPDGERPAVVPGVVVVRFSNTILPSDVAGKAGLSLLGETGRRHQVYAVEPAFPSVRALDSPSGAALRRIHYVRYQGEASPEHVAAELRSQPAVAYAEPLVIHRYDVPASEGLEQDLQHIETTPDDYFFDTMTHLEHIRAPEAWDVVKGEEGDVVVAIVDGGTDWRHEDLEANVWTNPGETPGNGVDDDGNGYVDDVHGWNFASASADPTGLSETPNSAWHGTLVAAVAAAVTNNGIGTAGMSWNARFMPINAACPTQDNAICYGYSGIVYAVDNGADIVNASWGSTTDTQLGRDVVAYAREQGTLVVAAAGNSNTNNDLGPFYPANYDFVLSVGATEKDEDTKAEFSNYGAGVNVFAPGVRISGAFPDNQYVEASGTSFAAPLVAGLAALVRTRFPDWSIDAVREQVRVTAQNIDGYNPGYSGLLGHGRIDAFRAVTETDHPAVRITGVAFEDSGDDGQIDRGETVEVTLTLTNFLADASGVDLTLRPEVEGVTVADRFASLGSLSGGASETVAFSFTLADDTPDEFVLRFALDIDTGADEDADMFTLHANEPRLITHDTGRLQVSLNSQGNIGWTNFAGRSNGVGFVYQNTNLLFEGGLLLGTGATRLSDNVRDETGASQENDFRPLPNSALRLVTPGDVSSEVGAVELTDGFAANPLGLTVHQESFADKSEDHRNFVVLKYTLENPGPDPIEDVFAGVFVDWDLNDDAVDFGYTDPERKLIRVQTSRTGGNRLVGTRLLTMQEALLVPIDNAEWLYDGFTKDEKWQFLQGVTEEQSLENADVSTITSAGPFTIEPGCSVEVAFALVAGSTASTFDQHVETAQVYWNRIAPKVARNPAPSFLTEPETLIVAEGDTLRFQYLVDDPEGCGGFRFSLLEGPEALTIDPVTGVLTFAPALDQAGSYPVTVMVTNGMLADTTSTLVTVTNQNRAPTFTTVLSDTTITEGETLTFTYVAVDPDDDPLRFDLHDPPPNAGIDPVTGAFSFSPNYSQGKGERPRTRTYLIEARVTDGTLTDVTTATVTVTNVNRAPVFADVPESLTVAEGDTLSVTYTASDPDGEPVVYRLLESPDNAAIDSLTGAFRFVPDYDQAGVHPVAVVVHDGALADTARSEVTVLDTNRPPFFETALPDTTVTEGGTLRFVYRATDPDGETVVLSMADVPRNASFDASQGIFQFAPDHDQAGTYLIQVTATDGQAADTTRAVVTVRDRNRAPHFTATLPDTTIVGGHVLTFRFQASDPDGDVLGFTLDDAPVPAVITADEGVLTFAPGYDQTGVFTLTTIVSDGTLADTARAVVTVEQPAFELELGAIFPNPAVPPVTFQYQLDEPGQVELKIYDLLGREVRTLVEAEQPLGPHEKTWDGRDEGGRPVASGVYLCRLVARTETGIRTRVRRVVVLR